MNRKKSIELLEQGNTNWDIIIIGGGATGLGSAMDAAIRGYKVLLLEQADFTKGTSSRSTKLVHGGVRYLQQGDVKLVLEALRERGLLLKNAPHLTENQSFIIPTFTWWRSLFYITGLKIYDILAGKLSLGSSLLISRDKTVKFLPTLIRENLKAGVVYHDGQFDDARLGINVAQTCVENGGHVINYIKVKALSKDALGRTTQLVAEDIETGKVYHLTAKVIVNATGVFVDEILQMENPKAAHTVRPSQGTHIVLDRSFLPTDYALMIPKTSDGRVLFAVPWHDKLVVGTTDTLRDVTELEPKPLQEEIDFILNTLTGYLTKRPAREDVKSVFSGLRPLARPQKEGKSTKEISRSHKLIVSEGGLVTITGGKWTTFRKMAEDTINTAVEAGGLKKNICRTENFPIHGAAETDKKDWLHFYGSDAVLIRKLMSEQPALAVQLHTDYPFVKAEVIWAVRNEMAIRVEDILARRFRILFMDARASIDMAKSVAELMADELGKDIGWVNKQLADYQELANQYLLVPYKLY